jgi:hypothetical protein
MITRMADEAHDRHPAPPRRRPIKRWSARAALPLTIAAGIGLWSAPTAVGVPDTTSRQDPYVEIRCWPGGEESYPTGDSYLAKRVDARAIQPDKSPGGKDTATDRYNENNPFGEFCSASES